MRYSIEPMDRIYVKGYGFLYFAKSISKNLSNKYSQKPLDTAKKSSKCINNCSKKSNSKKQQKQLVI